MFPAGLPWESSTACTRLPSLFQFVQPQAGQLCNQLPAELLFSEVLSPGAVAPGSKDKLFLQLFMLFPYPQSQRPQPVSSPFSILASCHAICLLHCGGVGARRPTVAARPESAPYLSIRRRGVTPPYRCGAAGVRALPFDTAAWGHAALPRASTHEYFRGGVVQQFANLSCLVT